MDYREPSQGLGFHKLVEWKRLSQVHIITTDGIYLKEDVESTGKIDEFDFYVESEVVYAHLMCDSEGTLRFLVYDPPKPKDSNDNEYTGIRVDGVTLLSGTPVQELYWLENPNIPTSVKQVAELMYATMFERIGYSWFVPDNPEPF